MAEADDGAAIAAHGVLYAPDYVINAGGVIALAKSDVEEHILHADICHIGDTLTAIFERADAEKQQTNVIADRMAEERLSAAQHRD